MKSKWYKLKNGDLVFKVGRYKVLRIRHKYNGDYGFYSCIVFDKGEAVDGEGLIGSSLNTKHKAVRWGMRKAKELGIIPKINY